jgi:integrase
VDTHRSAELLVPPRPPQIRLHDLRHAHATLALQAGRLIVESRCLTLCPERDAYRTRRDDPQDLHSA